MLTREQFEYWCRQIGLSDEAIAVVERIRNSPPVRAVRCAKGNVSGRYPSRKMGMTIQFESHKNELAFINIYEDDQDVLEYYDQSSTIKLIYEASNGRRLGVLHTPDFFLIRNNSAGWEECKKEEHLIKLALKSPNRYIQDIEGEWHCPPGESSAENLGLYYRIRSSKEIDWTYQRNLEFFEDYYRDDSSPVKVDVRDMVLKIVAEAPGIALDELFEYSKPAAKYDDIFKLIIKGELYVSLRDAPLVEQNKVKVYLNRETATAYQNLLQISAPPRLDVPHFVKMTVGSSLQWNGRGWRIVNVGETIISLVSEDKAVTELPIVAFEKLVQETRIVGLTLDTPHNIHPEAEKRIAQAHKLCLAEANYRCEIVRSYLTDKSLPTEASISERTIRRWSAKYRRAQEAYGSGYVALLPSRRSGNTNDKLSPVTRSLLEEFIENDYETNKQKGKYAVYADYLLACERRGVLPASYKTFSKAVKCRPRYNQTVKRQGAKAAYKQKEFYWELTPTIPRHGDWPLHIAHIDHTKFDEELVCSLTGRNLGRAWATFLTDAYSRRLAVNVTYDPPSYRSCMMIMRECVKRFGRLPQIVIVDGGKEFSSTYFETLLARYQCTKKTRPASESRFGSICERLFRTSNTQLIHNLRGNTQIMRNVREVTQAVNPSKLAIWTLEKLHLYLREWAYEVYDTNEHFSLGQSPRDAFANGMLKAGERAHRLIPYNDEFCIFTLPTTSKGTAKVDPVRGVKINQIYYWSDAFRHPEVAGTQVSVRFDPLDARSAFAYVRGQWTKCLSEHWVTFRGRSEREIMIATAELRRRHLLHSRQFNFTATKLARFLESIEAEEVLLQQRLADRATRNVLTLVGTNSHQQPTFQLDQSPSSIAKEKGKSSMELPSSGKAVMDNTPEEYEEF